MVVLSVASYFIISRYVLQYIQVVGVSMAPTLRNSDSYLLNRCVYHFRDPQRNEVVVLRDPIDNDFDVKRIIAASGDVVHLKGGRVYVNGRELEEPYLPPRTPTFAYLKLEEQRIQCGKDEYFVLGDNRKNSTDSRVFGPVPRSSILGLVVR
jgi:signal peptidase I